MNGLGKKVYGVPFRNNTEFSGRMRPYRFWRIAFDNKLQTQAIGYLSGFNMQRHNAALPSIVEMRDIDGNDLVPNAVRSPQPYWDGNGYSTFYPDTWVTPVMVYEWQTPVLIHAVRVVMSAPMVSWRYQYSWDGRVWVTAKEEDGQALFDTYGLTSFDLVRNLWI